MPFQRGANESARDVRGENPELENEFYLRLLKNGVIVPGIHVAFLSDAHTESDIDIIIAAYRCVGASRSRARSSDSGRSSDVDALT